MRICPHMIIQSSIYIYMYICVCVCVCIRYSIGSFFHIMSLDEIRLLLHCLPDRASRSSECNPRQAQHGVNPEGHLAGQLKTWTPWASGDNYHKFTFCLGHASAFRFCFLQPRCPSKLPHRRNWEMRSWRWWSILFQWCSIAAALDHLGSCYALVATPKQDRIVGKLENIGNTRLFYRVGELLYRSTEAMWNHLLLGLEDGTPLTVFVTPWSNLGRCKNDTQMASLHGPVIVPWLDE